MIVKELILELKKFHPEDEVYVQKDNSKPDNGIYIIVRNIDKTKCVTNDKDVHWGVIIKP